MTFGLSYQDSIVYLCASESQLPTHPPPPKKKKKKRQSLTTNAFCRDYIHYIADLTAEISAYHKHQLKHSRMPVQGKDRFFH